MENNSYNSDQKQCCNSGKKCCFSNPSCALVVSGVIFGLMALLHLYRVVESLPVVVGTTAVPNYVSVIALVVSGFLSYWMFAASKACKKE